MIFFERLTDVFKQVPIGGGITVSYQVTINAVAVTRLSIKLSNYNAFFFFFFFFFFLSLKNLG
jgi:hypothetical protein